VLAAGTYRPFVITSQTILHSLYRISQKKCI
jgi:hypothetical protein